MNMHTGEMDDSGFDILMFLVFAFGIASVIGLIAYIGPDDMIDGSVALLRLLTTR